MQEFQISPKKSKHLLLKIVNDDRPGFCKLAVKFTFSLHLMASVLSGPTDMKFKINRATQDVKVVVFIHICAFTDVPNLHFHSQTSNTIECICTTANLYKKLKPKLIKRLKTSRLRLWPVSETSSPA